MTFDDTGSTVTAGDTWYILFQTTDGTVSSATATDIINLNGTVTNPPVVTGTSATALTWTQAVPPTAAQVLPIASNLSISNASTSTLSGAVAPITANEGSQDVLGYNATLAAADGITVTGTQKLMLSGALPAAGISSSGPSTTIATPIASSVFANYYGSQGSTWAVAGKGSSTDGFGGDKKPLWRTGASSTESGGSLGTSKWAPSSIRQAAVDKALAGLEI